MSPRLKFPLRIILEVYLWKCPNSIKIQVHVPYDWWCHQTVHLIWWKVRLFSEGTILLLLHCPSLTACFLYTSLNDHIVAEQKEKKTHSLLPLEIAQLFSPVQRNIKIDTQMNIPLWSPFFSFLMLFRKARKKLMIQGITIANGVRSGERPIGHCWYCSPTE